jgi:hypothetical protein
MTPQLLLTGHYTQDPTFTLSLLSNFVNCYGCERGGYARSRMNTSDNAYAHEWGAVEFIPNPYNPVKSDWGMGDKATRGCIDSPTSDLRKICSHSTFRRTTGAYD